MAIQVVCTGCKKSFKVDDKHAGKTGACPSCKAPIKVPLKSEEVKVHAPDEFSGGGKGVTGKLLLKPIARQQTRIKPLAAAAIGGAVVAAIVAAFVLRGAISQANTTGYILRVVGLLLVTPPLVIAAYTFLRDDELEPHRGRLLFLRAGICSLVYMILWAVFGYLKVTVFPIDIWQWLVVAPPLLGVGMLAGWLSFDLEPTNGFFHYAFYGVVTMVLGWIAGLGWPW